MSEYERAQRIKAAKQQGYRLLTHRPRSGARVCMHFVGHLVGEKVLRASPNYCTKAEAEDAMIKLVSSPSAVKVSA